MTRRAARIDANQIEIVQTLRGVGASVQSLATQGEGCPDLLVGFRGSNWLMEVKNPNVDRTHRQLTVDESKWHQAWQGQIAVVLTPLDALRVIGVIE